MTSENIALRTIISTVHFSAVLALCLSAFISTKSYAQSRYVGSWEHDFLAERGICTLLTVSSNNVFGLSVWGELGQTSIQTDLISPLTEFAPDYPVGSKLIVEVRFGDGTEEDMIGLVAEKNIITLNAPRDFHISILNNSEMQIFLEGIFLDDFNLLESKRAYGFLQSCLER